ncbi:DUF72 domain-containing protein [Bradyrhizobium sp. AZCC 1614]|uniref:DUF72 domain-containing protein n=1 Tax=Bradyrhizobium sp. AZCC 1614 TaxID=3117017 RepID=UPI003FA599DF
MIRPGAIWFLPGRHPNSSRIGSGFPTIRSTALNCWKTACPYSARKSGRSCFSFRPTLGLTPTDSLPSSSFFRRKRRYSFEFRHPSWYSPEISRLLRQQAISLCISDHHDAPAPWTRTADFVYVTLVRPHGPLQGPL